MNYTVDTANDMGTLIYWERKNNKISQENLVDGVMSTYTLSNIENGSSAVEKITIDFLLRRMGISPGHFEMLIDGNDLKLYEKRCRIIEFVRKMKFAHALDALREYEESCTKEFGLHIQFVCYIRLYIFLETHRPVSQIDMLMEQIQELTMKGMKEEEIKSRLLSSEELAILILKARIYQLHGREEEAENLLLEIVNYRKNHHVDSREVILYEPLAILELCKLYGGSGRHKEILSLCHGMIDLLNKHRDLYGQIELRKEIIKALQRLNQRRSLDRVERQKLVEQKEYVKMLEELYRSYKIPFFSPVYFSVYENAYPFGEILRMYRACCGYTQEEFSEGVCECFTYSHYENGKVTPQREQFMRLMEKIGMSANKYLALVQGISRHHMALHKEMGLYLGTYQYKKAEKLLKVLKKELPDEFPKNKQLIKYAEAVIDYHLERIDEAKFYVRLLEALRVTIPSFPDVDIEKYPLMCYEAAIIKSLASCLGEQKQYGQATKLLKQVLCNYAGRKSQKVVYSPLSLVIEGYAKWKGLEGKYSDAIRSHMDGMIYALADNDGAFAVNFLYGIAWNYKQLNAAWPSKRNQQACQKAFRQAKCVAYLLQDEADMEFLNFKTPSYLDGMQN